MDRARRPTSRPCLPGLRVLGAGLLLVLACSCARTMTPDEARAVALALGQPRAAAARAGEDPEALLARDAGEWTGQAQERRDRMAAQPPDTRDPGRLAAFHHDRGLAAWSLGRFGQAREDWGLALALAERTGPPPAGLLKDLARAEMVSGHFQRAMELTERLASGALRLPTCVLLVKASLGLGDLEKARQARDRGLKLADRARASGKFGAWPSIHAAVMEADVLEAEGRWAEAETRLRAVVALSAPLEKDFPAETMASRLALVRMLLRQERLPEAEAEARAALNKAVDLGGRESGITAQALRLLALALLAQGRLAGAEKLVRTEMALLQDLGMEPESLPFIWARMALGDILHAGERLPEAMAEYDAAMAAARDLEYVRERSLRRNRNMLLCLILTGRHQEALALAQRLLDADPQGLARTELQALAALALARSGQTAPALAELSRTVPLLLGRWAEQEEGDFSRNRRLRAIVEEYLGLLGDLHARGQEQGLDAASEAFSVADAARGRQVRQALAASNARAAAGGPEQAALVRREQDLGRRLAATQALALDLLSAPEAQRPPAVLESLRAEARDLRTAQNALREEIQRTLPGLSRFTAPPLVSIEQIRQCLGPDEALVSVHVGRERTQVWAVPALGPARFATVGLGRAEVRRMTDRLRSAVDGPVRTLGDVPPFDLEQAWTLYAALFGPVEEGFRQARDLLFVTDGPLAQIPPGILPVSRPGATAPAAPRGGQLFSEYRAVPWLIRRHSVTQFPAASSLLDLRALPPGRTGRRAFIGFGDPLFSLDQVGQDRPDFQAVLRGGGQALRLRNLRGGSRGGPDAPGAEPGQFGLLAPLPDTREEILGMAESVGADPAQDVLLGREASKTRVLSQDLTNRKVVAFASHALVPGDLEGLDQPAIALSAPEVTGNPADGLLLMEDVLGLRLDADWVVLSACNTGAGDGEGAEAVSGLGRAFFHAGTRALLVSMWPVESASAMRLTTGLFRSQKENPELSRARALQHSILALMDGPGLTDPVTGRVAASAAHPLFWAPFVLVGEGGGR